MEAPRTLPALTDDLLEEIFLRVGSPTDLARASTACVAFRRLIADPSFLRRYRSVHPPPLLGLLDPDGYGFQPAEAPHPSAALARAVARAADFYHRRLPRIEIGGYWTVWDVRDGRVLFRSIPAHPKEGFPDLAVCDPLARRCLLLPRIPDNLFASVQQVRNQDFKKPRAFLAPPRDEEDDTSFRVVAMMGFIGTVVAFTFSAAAGHWSAGASVSWDALRIPLQRREVWPLSYAYGCFYWKVESGDKWLKFDMSSMELSTVDIPPGHNGNYVIIGEAGEGRLGMFGLTNNGTSLCYYMIRQIGGERFGLLSMDNIIPLPKGFRYIICGTYEGHIFMTGYELTSEERTCFTLEMNTLKIERVLKMRCHSVYPYFGFPPSMSQRKI